VRSRTDHNKIRLVKNATSGPNSKHCWQQLDKATVDALLRAQLLQLLHGEFCFNFKVIRIVVLNWLNCRSHDLVRRRLSGHGGIAHSRTQLVDLPGFRKRARESPLARANAWLKANSDL